MSGKDITERKLEDFADVFADIVNVLLFEGEDRVSGRHLRSALPRSVYKVGGRISEQERDTAKYWHDDHTCFALIGIENQTRSEKEMPLRVISYDGSDYRAQVRRQEDRKRKRKKARQEAGQVKEPLLDFYPVISMVLYFGLERWKKPVSLKDCLVIPKGLEEYVNDYKMHLFEIAYLEDSTVTKFKSDFRMVAEYFVQSRKIKEGSIKTYTLSTEELIHVKEVVELMSELTGDQSFEESYNKSLGGGKKSMWTLVDYIREQADERVEEEKKRTEEEKRRARQHIINMILLYKEQDKGETAALSDLRQVFSLSPEEAETVMEEYWSDR